MKVTACKRSSPNKDGSQRANSRCVYVKGAGCRSRRNPYAKGAHGNSGRTPNAAQLAALARGRANRARNLRAANRE